jgi:hypothetical protein
MKFADQRRSQPAYLHIGVLSLFLPYSSHANFSLGSACKTLCKVHRVTHIIKSDFLHVQRPVLHSTVAYLNCSGAPTRADIAKVYRNLHVGFFLRRLHSLKRCSIFYSSLVPHQVKSIQESRKFSNIACLFYLQKLELRYVSQFVAF